MFHFSWVSRACTYHSTAGNVLAPSCETNRLSHRWNSLAGEWSWNVFLTAFSSQTSAPSGFYPGSSSGANSFLKEAYQIACLVTADRSPELLAGM